MLYTRIHPSSLLRGRPQRQHRSPTLSPTAESVMLTDTQERQDLEAPAGPPGPLWRGRGNDSQGGEWVLLGNSPFTEPAYKGCGGCAAARGLLGKHPLHLHQLHEELVAALLVMDAPGPPALLLNHLPGRDVM